MSLRPLHEFDEAPALVLGQRPRLHEADRVAHLALVLLVVDLELRAATHVAAIRLVLHQPLDRHHHRLVHAVADHLAHAGLAAVANQGRRFGHTFRPSFSRSTVIRRAISRRPARILSGLSSWRMEFRNRRLNSSSRSSVKRSRISSEVISRIAVALAWGTSLSSQLVPLHETCPDRQLGSAELQRLLRERPVDPFQLEQHTARLDHRDPELRRTLAFAHTGLGRLLGHRLVGEYSNPPLAATLDEARDRDTRRLELAIGHPCRLHRLETPFPEGDRRAAIRLATHAAALLLALLDPLRHPHG